MSDMIERLKLAAPKSNGLFLTVRETDEFVREVTELESRLADEQAKRVAAEKEVATWRNAVQCTSTEVYLAEQLRQAEERDAERVKKWASTVAERDERIADLERRLSTVPEDFGPLIDRAMEAVTFNQRERRAALTEKIAALQFRLSTLESVACGDGFDGETLRKMVAVTAERDALALRLHSAELLLSRASGRLADGEELAPRAGQLIEDIADYFNKQRVVERPRGCPSGCGMPVGHEEPCFVVERHGTK